jgi:DNA polymerase III subunit delta
MTHEDILKDIKAGKYAPIYFLTGDEPYFIDVISDYIEKHALTEEEKSFNQAVLYGQDIESKSIVDEARQYPMMATRRVIIIKEAQGLKDLDVLESYIKKPADTSIVVFCYKHKKVDKRTSFAKLIVNNSVFFESKKLYDNQIAPWVTHLVKSKGYSINQQASQLIAEYIGDDLSRIVNEIDKLIVTVGGQKEISVDDVRREIGISKDFNVFDLQVALGTKNWVKANRIIRYLDEHVKSGDVIPIITVLFGYFYKVYQIKFLGNNPQQSEVAKLIGVPPFLTKEYIDAASKYSAGHLQSIFQALKKADHHSKGIGQRNHTPGSILKDVLISCMYAEATA